MLRYSSAVYPALLVTLCLVLSPDHPIVAAERDQAVVLTPSTETTVSITDYTESLDIVLIPEHVDETPHHPDDVANTEGDDPPEPSSEAPPAGAAADPP